MTLTIHDDDPHAWRWRGGRMSVPFQAYSATECAEARRPILAVRSAAGIVIQSLAHVRRQGQTKLLAFMVMPDHYHAIFSLRLGQDLSNLMRRIGSYMANRIRRTLDLGHPIRQVEDFYNRPCRNDQEVHDAVEYLHDNPAWKGLIAVPVEWPFSSAHPSRGVTLDWDWRV